MHAWRLNGSCRFCGYRIRYGVVGPEAAPAVVLLHGTPFSSYEWHRIIPWLARHFRVHFHDMLGYGASEKAEGDVSLGMQNAVFTELLDHWGWTALMSLPKTSAWRRRAGPTFSTAAICLAYLDRPGRKSGRRDRRLSPTCGSM